MTSGFNGLLEALRAERDRKARPTQPNISATLRRVDVAGMTNLVKALADSTSELARYRATLPAPLAPLVDRDGIPTRVHDILAKADQAFAAGVISGAELAELDARARNILASVQTIKAAPTRADRDAARRQAQEVMRQADADYAAKRIDSVRWTQIDWQVRRVLQILDAGS